MDQKIIDKNKQQIIDELKGTKRDGIEALIEEMEKGGFFTAPCSGKCHLSEEGGLAMHSLNVLQWSRELAVTFNLSINTEDASIVIAALLHDLGKMGQFGKSNYVPNVLKSGKVSDAEPYRTNKDLLYEEHEIRSVIVAGKYIDLTEEEQCAILHHNGLYGKLDSSYGNHNYDSNLLSFIIHTADMFVSRFEEV